MRTKYTLTLREAGRSKCLAVDHIEFVEMVRLLGFDMRCWRLAKGRTSATRACHE
jgi:hypothetical protein